MAEKKSFVLYTDYYDVVERLNVEQRGKLLKMMFDYHMNKNYLCDDEIVNTLFLFIKNQFDRDNEKWEHTKQIRAENGRKGGLQKALNSGLANLANASNTKQMLANASNTKQDLANLAVNVNDNVNVNVDVNVNDTVTDNVINYQQIIDLYHSTCTSYPHIAKLSTTRKKAISARLKQYTVDDFKTLFEKAEASSFLKGSNNRDWSADFDWLIKDANMAKVIEGKYDNKEVKNNGNGLYENQPKYGLIV